MHFVEAKSHFWSFQGPKSMKKTIWNTLKGQERKRGRSGQQNSPHFGAKFGSDLSKIRKKSKKYRLRHRFRIRYNFLIDF